ncbi:ABC transporter permease [Streptomyces sp. NPDC048282]|uniref:ABC transporter permease n=1 Tax=Streptomyces sp. NPDC048282 TaxID=3365528 RepID=UPI00371629C4
MRAVPRDTWWLIHRRLGVGVRRPGHLVITMVRPVVWLFLFGNLFQRVVELPGFGAASLSSNSRAGTGTLDEIERGTLFRFLITPVRRGGTRAQHGRPVPDHRAARPRRRRETVIALNTFLPLPLTFLPTAFMAARLMPRWMREVAVRKPVDWALVAGRSALAADPGRAAVLTRLGGLALPAALLVGACLPAFRAYRKSV